MFLKSLIFYPCNSTHRKKQKSSYKQLVYNTPLEIYKFLKRFISNSFTILKIGLFFMLNKVSWLIFVSIVMGASLKARAKIFHPLTFLFTFLLIFTIHLTFLEMFTFKIIYLYKSILATVFKKIEYNFFANY